MHAFNSRPNSGNVLFLILIAVALFAALSYVVTQSSRVGTGSTEREAARLEAARILSYVNQLRTAALRVSIAGTPREEIEVHLPGQTWAACSTGKKCIFGPQGGAAIAIDLEADAERDVYGNTWTYFDYTDAATVPDIGTADPDIILSRLMKIGPRGQLLCQAINDLLGIEGIPEVTAGNNGLGTFPAAPGQATACIKHFASHYAFYTTILEF